MIQAKFSLKESHIQFIEQCKRYGFKDKSQAIEYVIEKYESAFLEPELRPEYVEKLEKIRKGKYTRYKSVEELRKATS